ncbi:MAG: VWA domain-containing protein [Oscillospiraceae bacterium]|nr:VWA domain-containing protein [Oscillospiraceae bacterium]
MKKKQLIKALVFSAVLAAFPAAGLTASAEDAAPEALEVFDAPVAVAAEAAPVVAEVAAAPVVAAAEPAADAAPAADATPAATEAAPAATEAAPAATEATPAATEAPTVDQKVEPIQEVEIVEVDGDDFDVIEVPTVTTAKIDKEVIKAGETGKIEASVDNGFDIIGYDENGKAITLDYLTGTRFFSSDNSIATVDPDGTIHALKEGKVTIWCETLEGLTPVTLDITESYNVMLIDKSESVKGKGLAKEKAAAISFADEVLKKNKESHVAVIEMGSETTTKTLSGWTSNLKDIKNIVNGIKAEGGSVYSAAIKQAGALLNTIPYYKQGYNKNIVMFADGGNTYGDRDYAAQCLDDILYDEVVDTVEIDMLRDFYDQDGNVVEDCQIFVDPKNGKEYFAVDDVYYDVATGLIATGKLDLVKATELVPFTDEIRDYTTNFYAFGVYDSASKEAKDDGSSYLKLLAGEIEEDENGDVAFKDNYYEVTSVKDMQKNFKAIVDKKVVTEGSWVDNLIGFDVYVYGKGKSSSDDAKSSKAKKSDKKDSPATADSTGIYTIALFALLGAGAAAFTAKKRFED